MYEEDENNELDEFFFELFDYNENFQFDFDDVDVEEFFENFFFFEMQIYRSFIFVYICK